jgi:hypothetical protein
MINAATKENAEEAEKFALTPSCLARDSIR